MRIGDQLTWGPVDWDGMGFFVGMVSPVDLLICGPVEQGTSGMGHQVIEGPSERHASFWEII